MLYYLRFFFLKINQSLKLYLRNSCFFRFFTWYFIDLFIILISAEGAKIKIFWLKLTPNARLNMKKFVHLHHLLVLLGSVLGYWQIWESDECLIDGSNFFAAIIKRSRFLLRQISSKKFLGGALASPPPPRRSFWLRPCVQADSTRIPVRPT